MSPRGIVSDSKLKAIEEYNKSPNFCQQCNSKIEVRPKDRVNEVKKKKYCSQKCAAISSNKGVSRNKTKKNVKEIVNSDGVLEKFMPCLECGTDVKIKKGKNRWNYDRQYCDDCGYVKRFVRTGECRLEEETKESLFKRRPDWNSARVVITRNARNAFVGERKCFKCGYDKAVEICHIQSVSSFDGSATIGEVNHPTNLVALCRNHHWEFDHGYLKFEEGKLVPTGKIRSKT